MGVSLRKDSDFFFLALESQAGRGGGGEVMQDLTVLTLKGLLIGADGLSALRGL